MMEDSNITSRRLDELEIKASFADDLLDQLNNVILRQQTQIDRLTEQLLQLRQQIAQTDGSGPGQLRDELPPHY